MKTHKNPGDIIFYTKGNVERIRIGADGGFYVEGEKVTCNLELYVAFINFMRECEQLPLSPENVS